MKFYLLDCELHGGNVLDVEVVHKRDDHRVECVGHIITVNTLDLPVYETHEYIPKTLALNEDEKRQLLSRSQLVR